MTLISVPLSPYLTYLHVVPCQDDFGGPAGQRQRNQGLTFQSLCCFIHKYMTKISCKKMQLSFNDLSNTVNVHTCSVILLSNLKLLFNILMQIQKKKNMVFWGFFKSKNDHVSKILNFLGKLTLRKVKVTQISGSFERGDDDAMFVHLLPGRHPEVPLGGRHFQETVLQNHFGDGLHPPVAVVDTQWYCLHVALFHNRVNKIFNV